MRSPQHGRTSDISPYMPQAAPYRKVDHCSAVRRKRLNGRTDRFYSAGGRRIEHVCETKPAVETRITALEVSHTNPGRAGLVARVSARGTSLPV